MMAVLLDCAIRAALIGAGTAGVLWIFRIRQAAARHVAWAAVVLTMLVLPIWSWAGPKISLHVLHPPATAAGAALPDGSGLDVAPSMPDTTVPETTPSPVTHRVWPSWAQVLFGLYLGGALVLVARLAVGTLYAVRLRRSATLEDGRATSDRCATPITIGWFHPTLVLPTGWQAWSPAMLSAVLTHETEHARRRDPLVQWLALLNRALFWFHPLAWWLDQRLAALAEESCDAVVLADGHSPEAYAGYLLEVAKTVAMRGHRLRPVGMAMPGSGLKERVRLILNDAGTAPISRARLASTAVLCAASTVLFADATLMPSSASSPRVAPGRLERTADTVPTFDVVSIRPCKADDAALGARAGGTGPTASPGRLHIDCLPLAGPTGLIRRAYGTFASGTYNAFLHPSAMPVLGGPAWTKTDRYTIDAAAEGTPSAEMMNGPMLQALLEDRFQLKVRHETKDVPVYDLTVAKGGAKLKPFDGRCTPVDFTKGNIPAQLEAVGSCPISMHDTTIEAPGQTIGDFITFALTVLDRPVVDRTGLTGRFDIHLTFAPEEGKAIADLTATLAPALQRQLGLTLVPANSSGSYLVIDSVARPTNDAPPGAPQATPSARPANPSFEAASIKPCQPGSDSGGRRGGGGGINASPGQLEVTCLTIAEMIGRAYVQYGDPRPPSAPGFIDPNAIKKLVSGGPEWIYTDRYTIEAKTSGTPAPTTMVGPMLRALLEDRLHLTLHQDQRTIPAYSLTVAPGGLKIRHADPDSCHPPDPEALGRAAKPAAGGQPLCANGFGNHGPNMIWTATGVTLDQVARGLGGMVLDHPVQDRTGVAGQFTFQVEFVRDESTGRMGPLPPAAAAVLPPDAVADVPPAPSIFSVLEHQLGLVLTRGQGPEGYLTVDHVERPSGG